MTAPGCPTRRGSICSSRSSPPSRTAPASACRPRTGSSRRTAARSKPTGRPTWAAHASASACRARLPHERLGVSTQSPRSPQRRNREFFRCVEIFFWECPMKPTVLVIDDEKTFRVVAEEALSAEGFDVTTAPSGAAGLGAWRAEPHDLVVLDRNLPDTDGIRVLEEIARESRERGIDSLVVIATAYADVQSAVAALKVGAFDYLSKPLQLPELVVTVKKALEAKRLRS